jgi:quinol-cytochrome oxidoreductase complex cytochrome b subunit
MPTLTTTRAGTHRPHPRRVDCHHVPFADTTTEGVPMSNGLVIGFSALHVIFIIWATIVGHNKGRTQAGFLLGLFLSWIGLIIIYVMSPKSTYAR